jgi:hypothetical protein
MSMRLRQVFTPAAALQRKAAATELGMPIFGRIALGRRET